HDGQAVDGRFVLAVFQCDGAHLFDGILRLFLGSICRGLFFVLRSSVVEEVDLFQKNTPALSLRRGAVLYDGCLQKQQKFFHQPAPMWGGRPPAWRPSYSSAGSGGSASSRRRHSACSSPS